MTASLPLSTTDFPKDATLRVVIAGGGTGGHLYPGIALAESFLSRVEGSHVHFVGALQGIEARVLPRENRPAFFLDMARIRGGGIRVALRGIFKLPLAILRTMGFFRRLKPHLVIGVGGYASGAAILAATLMGIPRVVQEQNAIPGITNRVAGKLVHRVYTSFKGAEAHFPVGRVRCMGNPIRAAIREALDKVKREESEEQSRSRILVFGGSQGARFLNQNVPALLASLAARRGKLEIIHQTGIREEEETRERYRDLGVEADVRPYLHDMAEQYAAADLAICRAGASTLAEVTAVGVPTVLVPFPYAANDHQTANAREISDVGGGWTVPQTAWNTDQLAGELATVLGNEADLQAMADSARQLGRPEAADSIVEDALELLIERGEWAGGLAG